MDRKENGENEEEKKNLSVGDPGDERITRERLDLLSGQFDFRLVFALEFLPSGNPTLTIIAVTCVGRRG